MAFLETAVDAFGNLSVGGVSLYSLVDVGLVLAVGIGAVMLGKAVLEKLKKD